MTLQQELTRRRTSSLKDIICGGADRKTYRKKLAVDTAKKIMSKANYKNHRNISKKLVKYYGKKSKQPEWMKNLNTLWGSYGISSTVVNGITENLLKNKVITPGQKEWAASIIPIVFSALVTYFNWETTQVRGKGEKELFVPGSAPSQPSVYDELPKLAAEIDAEL